MQSFIANPFCLLMKTHLLFYWAGPKVHLSFSVRTFCPTCRMKVAENIGPALEQFGPQLSWNSQHHQFKQRLLDFRKWKAPELAK